MRGHAAHAAVDSPGTAMLGAVRIERSLPLWSERLSLIGIADVVEFDSHGTPYPVEYKHGSRRKAAAIAKCDDVQLGAQAMCLEEMTGRTVTRGALFYEQSKRRREVAITDELRTLVEQTAAAIRMMLASGTMPAPTDDRSRCRPCSLRDLCQPDAIAALRSASIESLGIFDPDC